MIKHRGIILCTILAGLTFAVYWQVRNFNFISLDDGLYIYHNKMVQAGLTVKGLEWAFGFNKIAYWHPLTWISHMAVCHFFGLKPVMHHMTNVIIHVLNSMLLFWVLERATGEFWKSGFVAALFALHPVNVESVAWIAERKNVLSAFFWMLTLAAYIYYSERPCLSRYFLSLFLFLLGLLSKPVLITLPIILLFIDYWPLKRVCQKNYDFVGTSLYKRSVRAFIKTPALMHLFAEKIPFVILSIGSVWISIMSAKQHGIMISYDMVPLTLRIENGMVSFFSYIGKMIYPQNLSVFYPYPETIPTMLSAGAGIVLLIITCGTIWFYRTRPYLFTGWIWFIAVLLPTIGISQAGLWPALADRWAYLPFIGIFIASVWGIHDLIIRFKIKIEIVAVIAAAIFLLMILRTWQQTGYWENNEAIYQHAIDVTENNAVAHNNLGAEFYSGGEKREATAHFIEAIRIDPDYMEGHNNLKIALNAETDLVGAITTIRRVMRIYPENPGLFYHLGGLYRQKRDIDRAIHHYVQAMHYYPMFDMASFDLASTYLMKGDLQKALRQFKKTIQIRSDLIWAYYYIAVILSMENKQNESVAWLERAIKMGFHHWDYIKKDKRLANICESESFKKLILERQQVIK